MQKNCTATLLNKLSKQISEKYVLIAFSIIWHFTIKSYSLAAYLPPSRGVPAIISRRTCHHLAAHLPSSRGAPAIISRRTCHYLAAHLPSSRGTPAINSRRTLHHLAAHMTSRGAPDITSLRTWHLLAAHLTASRGAPDIISQRTVWQPPTVRPSGFFCYVSGCPLCIPDSSVCFFQDFIHTWSLPNCWEQPIFYILLSGTCLCCYFIYICNKRLETECC